MCLGTGQISWPENEMKLVLLLVVIASLDLQYSFQVSGKLFNLIGIAKLPIVTLVYVYVLASVPRPVMYKIISISTQL